MNDEICKIAIKHNVLNYVDNETPPIYFVHGNVNIEDINNFAEEILNKCFEVLLNEINYSDCYDDFDKGFNSGLYYGIESIKNCFGIEE